MAQRPMQIWEFATTAERDGTGTDDGLEAGDVSYVVASNAWFYAATVAAGSSTWTAVTAGSGTTLAATLAAGNVTGGTDLEVTAGDSFTLNENATVPGGAPAAGEGKLWVRSDAPNVLVFTDDAGTDHVLGTGSGSGDVTGPGSSTDDALARFDSTTGKVIQNSVGVLSDAGDLSGLNDITLAGTVDGRDVAADGTTLDNHVADTSNPHTTTLALALSSGSTTGGTGPEISAGDPVTLNENASVPGGAPAAGKGKIWVRNDSPNVLIFTDDAGTDIDLTSGGSTPTLSQVLGAGSSTGGDDLTVTTGDSVVFPLTSGSNVNLTESSGFSIATDGGADDVVIDTSAGTGAINLTPGGDLVLDYATWPASDGSASQVLRTDGAGNLSWASGSQGLDSVLVVGNQTAGTDIVVTGGDSITGDDAVTPGGALALRGGNAAAAGNGGAVTVTGGAGNTNGNGGLVTITGGARAGGGDGGDVDVLGAAAVGGRGGTVTVVGGTAGNGEPGDVVIRGGAAGAGSSGDGGLVTITGGAGPSTGVFGGGAVSLTGGIGGASGTSAPGTATVRGGNSGANTNAGAAAYLQGGFGLTTGAGGDAVVQGGTGGSSAAGGGITILAGGSGASAATGGAVTITAGDSGTATGTGANVTINGGDTTGAGTGGNIVLNPGTTSGGTDGAVIVNGKLTVTGTIDPTDLVLDEQSDHPTAPAAGKGILWVRDDTPNVLVFTDDAGTDVVLGASTTPDLASVLVTGNTTGGTDLVITSGDSIDGSDMLTLTTSDSGEQADFIITAQAGAGLNTFRAAGTGTTTRFQIDTAGTNVELQLGASADAIFSWNGSGNVSLDQPFQAAGLVSDTLEAETTNGDLDLAGDGTGSVHTRTGDTPAANAVRHRTARTTISPGSSPATMAVAYSLTSNETAVILRGDVTGIGQVDGDDLVRATFEGTWYRSGGTVTAGVTSVTSQGINGALTDDPAWSVSVDISGDDIRIRVTSADTGGTNQNIIYVGNWTAQLVS